MKIKKKLYVILVLTVLFGSILTYMENWWPPAIRYPSIVSAPVQMFFHSIFLLFYFFWINTTFRYEDRATVYKKNLKYIVTYVAISALLLSVCIALEFLYYHYVLYLAFLIGALLCAIIGIEAAIRFNKKHPPKFFAEENKLTKFIFCAFVFVSVLFNFDSISKLRFFILTADQSTYNLCIQCILVIVFFELAQKLHSNGNKKIVLTCSPLILTVYITKTLCSWFCITTFDIISRSDLDYRSFLEAISYLQIVMFYSALVIAYSLLGIFIAYSMQKKEDKEKQTIES